MNNATPTTEPKSYLSKEDREAIMQEGGMDMVCMSESVEAGLAGDEEAAWAWFHRVKLSGNALKMAQMWGLA